MLGFTSLWVPLFCVLVIWLWVSLLNVIKALHPVEVPCIETNFYCFIHYHKVHVISDLAQSVCVVKINFVSSIQYLNCNSRLPTAGCDIYI
jgi:hypothetical protein